MKVSGAGREGTVLREAAWPLVGRLNSSRLPGPAVSTLQGEALGLSRRHWAGRAAQIGTVGSCGMPRRIRVLSVELPGWGIASLIHASGRQGALRWGGQGLSLCAVASSREFSLQRTAILCRRPCRQATAGAHGATGFRTGSGDGRNTDRTTKHCPAFLRPRVHGQVF